MGVNEIGNRILFDAVTGEILHQTGEMVGDVSNRLPIQNLSYMDLPFGFTDYTKNIIKSIDVESGIPVLESLPETKEQRKIRELEDALLIQAENENGGIL